jgi:hypothetical protein
LNVAKPNYFGTLNMATRFAPRLNVSSNVPTNTLRPLANRHPFPLRILSPRFALCPLIVTVILAAIPISRAQN